MATHMAEIIMIPEARIAEGKRSILPVSRYSVTGMLPMSNPIQPRTAPRMKKNSKGR